MGRFKAALWWSASFFHREVPLKGVRVPLRALSKGIQGHIGHVLGYVGSAF